MAIAQKPKRQPATADRAAAFIAGAVKPANDNAPGQEADGGKKVTTLRFDPELLRKIDQAAKRRGVSRTAWIMMAASRAIDEGL